MIREVSIKDAKAITDIYNYYIRNSVANLEETEIDESFFNDKILKDATRFPWLVYEKDHKIIGFAYASEWKARSGYKKSAELTVYLHHNNASKGIGTRLYKAVIDRLKEMDVHAVVGGISLPNEASVRLHEKFGFEKVAHYKEIGYKFNKWVDVGYWQLIINKK